MSHGPNDPIQILIFSSLFREELPWLYELGVETYRALVSRDRAAAKHAMSRYRDALEMARSGRFMDIFGIDSKMTHMMLMDALEFMPLMEWENFPLFDDDDASSQALNSKPTSRKGKTI